MTTLITEDEVVKMARQAGATEIGHKPPAFHLYIKDLEAFAKLVAEKSASVEREACLNCYSPDDTATDWSDKIRARGEA